MPVISHRQLVSATISLLLPTPTQPHPVLQAAGYELSSLELRVVNAEGSIYQADLHLTHDERNLSLLVDCKTYGGLIADSSEQIRRYFSSSGQEVILASSITSQDPASHQLNPVFIVLPDVTGALSQAIPGPELRRCDGWGILEFGDTGFTCVHDELSDESFSKALDDGYQVPLDALPLELLPYEIGCPAWELANHVFRAIMQMYVTGKRSFTTVDLGRTSNGMWDYLGENQRQLEQRLRRMTSQIARTALRKWLSRETTNGDAQAGWRFVRQPNTRVVVLDSFKRRHEHFINLLREGRDPRSEDFLGIDAPEQLAFPSNVLTIPPRQPRRPKNRTWTESDGFD